VGAPGPLGQKGRVGLKLKMPSAIGPPPYKIKLFLGR